MYFYGIDPPVIDSFDGDYSFLSNFHIGNDGGLGIIGVVSPATGGHFGNSWFTTVENAYQTLKFEHLWDDPEKRRNPSKYGIPSSFNNDILSIINESPGKSKRKAKKYEHLVDPAFHERKVSIMFELVWSKFDRNPVLKQKLLDTAPCKLIEGNTWGDTFWGVCNGRGENHLGRILMDVRMLIDI